MANKKINELVSRTPSLSDLMLVGDPSSGYSYKCTVTALATIIETDISDGYVTLSTAQTISGAKTFSNVITATTVPNTPTDPDKFLTLNSLNVITYRTGAQVLSDIGAQAALTNPVTGTGTTNYLPKFTGTSTIGNSQLIDDGTTIFLGTSGSLPNVKMIISTTSQRALELTSTTGNALFVSSGGAYVMTVTNGTWATQFTQAGRLDLGGDLSITTIANATTDTDKFLVSDAGVVKYRTGSEVLSDIGGASSASISGTTNYIPKFTSSSAIGNSNIYESGGAIKINTTGTYNDAVYKFVTKLTTNRNIAFGTQSGDASIEAFNDAVNASVPLRIYGSNIGIYAATSAYVNFNIGTSEQMRLTSTGLGIGTSSPAYKLDVNGTGQFVNNVSGNATNVLTITNAASAVVNTEARLFLSTVAGNNRGAYISAIITSTSNDNALIFATNSAGVSPTEKVRITSSGNVGIGSSSPIGNLDVASLTPSLYIRNTKDGSWTSGETVGALNFYTNDVSVIGAHIVSSITSVHDGVSTTAPAGALVFSTAIQGANVAEVMRLSSSGNLGIGVTPSAWSSNSKAMQLPSGMVYTYNNDRVFLGQNVFISSTNADAYYANGYATTYRQYQGTHAWFNAPSGTASTAITFTQAMTLDASGNLLVGSTSVSGFNSAGLPLIVGNGSGNKGITIYSGNTSAGSIHFADGASNLPSYAGYINYNHSTNSMQFGTDNTERMRLDASGNLGLGVTPSAWSSGKAFEVAFVGNALWSNSGDNTILSNNAYNISGTGWVYARTAAATNYAQIAGQHRWNIAASGTAGNAITFTQAMTLDASGNLLVGATANIASTRRELVIRGANGSLISLGNNTTADRLQIASDSGENALINNKANTPMIFYTNGSERMRIKASGVINISNIPTSSSGLSTGDIWSDGGTLKIV